MSNVRLVTILVGRPNTTSYMLFIMINEKKKGGGMEWRV